MSIRVAEVRAQAKLNLVLRILARERSGYHQIETLFTRIALADEVRVRTGARGRSLDVSGPALPDEGLGPVEVNLAWRAAEAYAAATGWPDGIAIEIVKHIPVGGGLGGGSADAGAVLRALDALAPRPLGAARLAELGSPLGADVPFLASGAAHALAWGRGDRILPLAAPPERAVCLLLPPFPISTAMAYGWVAAARGDRQHAGGALLDAGALSRWDALAAMATNDFEPEVERRHAEIAALRTALRDGGAAIARLSGSGSAVFGIMPADADAPRMPPAGAPPGTRALATRTAPSVEEVRLAE